jgi:hypothetical protein
VTGLLTWLEASALGSLMRESGVWAYAVVNLGHILGVSALFGSVVVLDLRLLGVWKRVPLGSLTAPLVPVAGAGFCLAAVTGLCMLSANGSEYAGNPFLLIKFPAIAVGLLNVAVLGSSRAWKARESLGPDAPLPASFTLAGAVSLAAWLTAVAAGRMIGYW